MRRTTIILLSLLICTSSLIDNPISARIAYVISNQIDWALNSQLLSKVAPKYGIILRRVTNLSLAKNSNVLILGGHLAPTDEWMPKNYAEELLNEEEKSKLESGKKAVVIKTVEKNGNRITIIAGYNRYNTSLATQSNYDWDSLPNAVEAMLGTDPRQGDTDNDTLPDDKEVLEYLTDPLSIDTDSDGESDAVEILVYETDPKKPERWQDFNTVVRILNAPKKISRYMEDHFTYYSDPEGEDIWQKARETFYRKGGDCEDYAIFALYCLRMNGWSYDAFDVLRNNSAAVMGITWYGFEEGHAVMVYVMDGRYYVIHNGLIPSEGPFPDLESLIDLIAQRLFFFSPPWEAYFFINEHGEITEIVEKG